MAEPTLNSQGINPADLVPFVDETKKIGRDVVTAEQARKEMGIPEKELDHQGMFDGFAKMRELIDNIPTPGEDAGDAISVMSPLSLIKDTLSAGLNLMEAPAVGRLTPEYIAQQALDVAPTGAAVAMKTIPRGAIGMFGSRPSWFASNEIRERWLQKFTEARKLEKEGKTLDEIWSETGMSKDHNGEWRYEIADGPDTVMDWDKWDEILTIRDSAWGLDAVKDDLTFVLSDFMEMPRVYEHWPELKNTKVKFFSDGSQDSELAYYNRPTKTIHMNVGKSSSKYTTPEIFIHEAQHALQHMQGRPGGTNDEFATAHMKQAIETAGKLFRKAMDSGGLTAKQSAAWHKIKEIDRAWHNMKQFHGEMAAYWADPGEIEARLSADLHKKGMTIDQDDVLRSPSQNPSGDWRKEGAQVPDLAFTPDDIRFPSADPVADNVTLQKKPFGTRGTEKSGMAAPRDPKEVFKIAPLGEKESIGQVPKQTDTLTSDYYAFENRQMKPSEFLKIAEPFDSTNFVPDSLEFMKSVMRGEVDRTIAPPWLVLEWQPASKIWQARGHEGRHRSTAAMEIFGDKEIPVQLFFRGPNGNIRTPALTAEQRDALKNKPIVPERLEGTEWDPDQ